MRDLTPSHYPSNGLVLAYRGDVTDEDPVLGKMRQLSGSKRGVVLEKIENELLVLSSSWLRMEDRVPSAVASMDDDFTVFVVLPELDPGEYFLAVKNNVYFDFIVD